MREESPASMRVRDLLKPYASNWTGTLGRGDLVIPQRELPRLVEEIVAVLGEGRTLPDEASDRDVFETLMAAQRSPSVQDHVAALRRKFRIVSR